MTREKGSEQSHNEDERPPTGRLTPLQQRFVAEYLVDLNGTQAAVRAGYSQRSASTMASRLRGRPAIAALIAQKIDARAARARVTADRETDTIATAQFVLPQSAQDATLAATNVTIFDSSKKARIWFEATNAETFRTAFSGKRIDVDHSITTTGVRRFNETIELKIREK